MTKKYSTKRALIASALTLALCFTALMGTTFAWFTDSAVSSGNVIKTGELNVELYQWTAADASTNVSANQAPVFAGTDADGNPVLWEPGKTEVRYLSIKNEGTLDLKYKVAIKVAGEEDAELLEVMSYAITPDAKYGDVTAWDATKANKITDATTVYAEDVVLESGAEHFFAISIHMDETAGNEYQNKSIEFDVQVLAAQLASEEDSFDATYDEEALYPVVSIPVAIPAAGVTEDVAVKSEEVAVVIPAAVVNALPAGVTSVAVAHTEPKVEANDTTGEVKATFDALDFVDQNGNVIDLANLNLGEEVTVKLALGSEFAGKSVYVYHDGEMVTATPVTADANGVIEYTAAHFCEVVVSSNYYVATAAELVAAITAGESKIYLAKDIAIDGDNTITIAADKKIEIDLNGKTISAITDDADKNDDGKLTSADNEVVFDVRGTLTVKNGAITVEHKSDNFGWNACTEVFYVGFNGALNVENATIENLGGSDMAYAIDLVNATNVYLNVVNSTLKSSYIPVRVFNNGSGMNNVTIKGSDLVGTSRAFWVHVYSSADNGGKGVKDATLNLDIYGNGNTFKANKAERLIEFGFDNPINFDAEGKLFVATYDELVAAIANGYNVVLRNDIDAESKNIIIKKGQNVTIDLNGKILSAVCNDSQDYLIGVNNGAELTVCDSSADESGKILFTLGNSTVGWTVLVEGKLNLKSGTIELAGDNPDIVYAIDLRPNSWGTEFTAPSTVIMDGGKLVSSDGGIRVASSSADGHKNVSANFVMNGGEIVAKRDGIFIQQSNNCFDVLNVTLNGGKITSKNLAPIRFYGPATATGVVGGVEKPMTLVIENAAELVLESEKDASRTWYNDDIVLGGGATLDTLATYANIIIK